MELNLTPEERTSEKLSNTHLQQACKAIRTNGFVVLNDVVKHDHLNTMRKRMVEDLEKILKAPNVPHNFVWGNVQQDPPPYKPYVFRDVVANPWVAQISRTLLGEGVFNDYYSGNSNMPGSLLQPVHTDFGQLWPNLEVAHPAVRLAINIAMDDAREENGSIELWPGSHLDTTLASGGDLKVPQDVLEKRREIAPPVRGNTQKGSILIRDLRLWHRGTENISDQTRFMIAMIHNCRWFRRRYQPKFEIGCEPMFENSDLESNVVFVKDPSEYLHRNKPYEYDGSKPQA